MNGTEVALSYLANVGYTAAQQVSGLTLGNGLTETYGYSPDGRLQLANQKVLSAGTPLLDLTYDYATEASGAGRAAG